MKPIPDICVVGTDTGVGKSVVSLLLMQMLHAGGYNPFYLKPFQTGCADPHDKESDAAFVYRHTAALKCKDPAQSVIFCHPNPKAPYFASRDAGEAIDPEMVLRRIETQRCAYSPLVVEAAGGLLVPVTEKLTVLDLIALTHCRPLLVARAGLGTINHTLLSIQALKNRRRLPFGIVLANADAPAEPELVNENIEAIEAFSGIRVDGVIARISDFSAPPPVAYQPLKRILF